MSKTISKDSDSACIRIRGVMHRKAKAFCDKKGYKLGFFTEFCLAKNIPEEKSDKK